MDVKEISGNYPGSSKVYQIDGKDLVDIGATVEYSEDFRPENVEKIALTCPWIEHSENLNMLERDEEKHPIQKISDPKVCCSDTEELSFGRSLEIVDIEHGETIELSGYKFKVIVIPGGHYKEAMFYNRENSILFSGDVPSAIGNESELSDEALNRIKNTRELEINEEFPAMNMGKSFEEAREEIL